MLGCDYLRGPTQRAMSVFVLVLVFGVGCCGSLRLFVCCDVYCVVDVVTKFE